MSTTKKQIEQTRKSQGTPPASTPNQVAGQLTLNFGLALPTQVTSIPFCITFPNADLSQVMEKNSMDKAQLLRRIEVVLREEMHDPQLHVLNIRTGSVLVDCLTNNLSEPIYSCIENDLMSRALGEPQKLNLSLPFGPGKFIEYDDVSVLKEALTAIIPKPPRLGLPSAPKQNLITNTPTNNRTKENVAAEVELLMENCILGKPLRTDEDAFDDDMNEVPAVNLYWYPMPTDEKKRRIGMIITDSETRIVCPDVPPGTTLNNQAPNYALLLTRWLKDYLSAPKRKDGSS
jgi:hypothetical protein